MFNSIYGKPKSQPRKRQTKQKPKVKSKEIPETKLPETAKTVTQPTNRTISPSSNFKHPTKISSKWDINALDKVEKWLRVYINDLPIGEPIEIGKTSILSRDIAKILPGGNIEGFRYLLGKLKDEGYIDVPDNSYFIVLRIK